MRSVAVLGLIGAGLAGKALAAPGITLTPSVGLSEVYSDNSFGGASGRPSTTTQFSPGLAINGETAHTTINFNYLPVYNHFNDGSSKDRIDQNLNAVAKVTPFSEMLTIDFTAFATEAGASGNSSNQAGILIPTDNQVLYFVGTAAPHFQTHFGDIATVDAYYRLNSTNTSDAGVPGPGRPSTSSNSLGQDFELAIGSADSLGRVGVRLDFNHGITSGSGANNQSTNDSDILGVNVHVNRVYTVNGSIGYQSTDYPTNGDQPGYKQSGPTWSLGVTITPNLLSAVSIGYGYSQGAYSPSIQIGYALGPRTTLVASYLVTVENQLTSALQNSRFLSYDQFGNAVDSRTGLPFSGVNQTFGSQNVLFRDKPALVTISHQLMRSSISLTATYEVRNSLSGPTRSDAAWGATVNYTRELTPLMQGNVSLGYTRHTSSVVGTTDRSNNIDASATLFYTLSDTASANLTETYFSQSSSTPGQSSSTEQLTIGIRKSF